MRAVVFGLILLSFAPAAFAEEYPELGVRVETVAGNLDVPWSIDWLPGGDIIFTERGGDLRIISDGKLQQEPVLSLDVSESEGGLLGVAVDPDHVQNNYIYLYYTYSELFSVSNKVVRYQLVDGQIGDEEVLLDKIPAGFVHNGGRIQFGPDGKLYIGTGDAGKPEASQDMGSLAGKILRINPDGSVPGDNPRAGSPVYSTGHRNPQGMDWDANGIMVTTDHGPSGERGFAHDEINVVVRDGNYGWPDAVGDETMEGRISPALHTGNDVWAPSGSEFYDGGMIEGWENMYFVAALRGSHLHMMEMDVEGNAVVSDEVLFQGDFGRLRDVETGPDGYLYLLTSNRDGRGSPGPADDRILRVVPMDNSIGSFEECIAAGNPGRESDPRQCITEDGVHFEEKVENCKSEDGKPISIRVGSDGGEDFTHVTVEGCAGDLGLYEAYVTLRDPDGEIISTERTLVYSDGRFWHTFEEGHMANGTYVVTVDAEGFSAEEAVVVPEFEIVLLVLVCGISAMIWVFRAGSRIGMMPWNARQA